MKTNYPFILLAALIISFCIQAEEMESSAYPDQYGPSAEQMILDGLVYRPLSLAGTVIGTGIYIVTLPFSLIGGNADEAAQRLIVDPAKATFDRCLGCLSNDSYRY